MTTEQYRVFYQVAESGSISRAAKVLFVSQPAVTKSIKTLEKELDVILFHRDSKGVTLTREGEVLFHYVKEAFEQLGQGEKMIRQLKDGSIGTVKIGISNILCKYYFMPHLRRFHELYPNLKIEIVNRTSPETLELLEQEKIDCAIISEIGDKNLYEYHHLLEIQDIFVSKEQPPKDLMELYELGQHPLLLLEKKNSTRRSIDEYFLENQMSFHADIEISSMEFLVEFAKIGLGVAAVIGDFVQEEIREGSLYQWKVHPPMPKRSIGLLHKKGNPLSIASRAFIEYMLGVSEIK